MEESVEYCAWNCLDICENKHISKNIVQKRAWKPTVGKYLHDVDDDNDDDSGFKIFSVLFVISLLLSR